MSVMIDIGWLIAILSWRLISIGEAWNIPSNRMRLCQAESAKNRS